MHKHPVLHYLALSTTVFVVLFSILVGMIAYRGSNPTTQPDSPVKAAGDFKTQLVKMVIQTGQLSGTAIAPTNFQAVDPDKTILLISGVTQHPLGDRANTTQNPDDISAVVELTDGATITATRADLATRPTEIWVSLIEYIGSDGGQNEFIVRDRTLHPWTDGNLTETYGPIPDIIDNQDVVVFNNGVINPNTSSDQYDRGDVRSYLDGLFTVNLFRGDGAGAISSAHQVVEFTGTSWTIQQGDAVPDRDPNGTDIAINPVVAVENAFVYFTWDTDLPNLDERGHRAWLTSDANLRLQEHAAASGVKNIRWYVIENPDMTVQTGADDNQHQSVNQATITGFTPVEDISRSFVWMTGMTNGGGNAHPRDMWQFELVDDSTINLERGYSGQNLDYRYFVIELPLGPAPSIQQMHYHWRNDDGDELTATSATGGTQDTILPELSKNQRIRLRLQASNQGTLVSGFNEFRLEYGQKMTSCSTVVSWEDVGAIGGDFDMSDSPNLSDGQATTNIPVTDGGTTDENATFRSFNAGVKDLSSETTGFTMSQFEFIEVEYSIEALGAAQDGATYCFRLSNAGADLDAYQVYAEATIESFNDFKIQRGTLQMSGVSQTITAGVDYVAPALLESAFIRITNSQHTGAGNDTGGGNQNADDVTAYIADPENLLTSITFMRDADANNSTHINWEIIEYIGPDQGRNQIVVRETGNTTFGINDFNASTAPIANIGDDTKVVPFITAHMNPDNGRSDYNTSLATAFWNAATNEIEFTRADTEGDAAIISWAVVEFIGVHWNIQRAEHTYVAAGVVETEIINEVNDVSRAFLHTQKRVGDNLQNLDEYGHEIWLSDTNELSFQLQPGATNPDEHVSVVWVIENTQLNGTPMVVTRSDGATAGGPEPNIITVPIGTSLNDLSVASIFINNRSSGGGNAHPRAIMGARISSTTEYELFRSDTGQTATYRTEIVEWPSSAATVNQIAYKFFENEDSTEVVTAFAAQDTPAELGAFGQAFRLRLLFEVEQKKLIAGSEQYTLQFAQKVGACDSGFAGEVYENVTTTSLIAFNDNPTPSDAEALTPTIQDPIGANTIIPQTYEEENDFTGQDQVAVDTDTLWDFSLIDNGASAGTSYCFRVIRSSDVLLESYGVIPEVMIFPGELSVDIVDAAGDSVDTPGIDFTAINYDADTFLTTVGIFGSLIERLRVTNTTSNPQWTLSLAPTGGNASVWIGSTDNFDFNDPEPNAEDGADIDSVGGQMTVDPTSAIITGDTGCSNTDIFTGPIASFEEGVLDALTLASSGATADTNCFWDLTDFSLNQSIPQAQPAQIYTIDMTISIVAM